MDIFEARIQALRKELEQHNYNYYVQYYRNTFQHGGISMEEMIIPLVTLRTKQR